MADLAPPPRRTTTTTTARSPTATTTRTAACDRYTPNIPPSPHFTTATTPTTPGLTQSTSNPESMQSPSEPKTPVTPVRCYQRQARPRYPQEMTRVPLHRRGTSKTYERLEDLLKEAGYKETRIFTPEAERKRKGEEVDDDDDDTTVVEDKRTSVMKDGVGAVMGFLAGLVNVGAKSTNVSPPNSGSGSSSPTRCSPPSPPANASVEQQVGEAPHRPPHPDIVVHPTSPLPNHHHHRAHDPNHLRHQQHHHHHQHEEFRHRLTEHHDPKLHQHLPSYHQHLNGTSNRLQLRKGLGLGLSVAQQQQQHSPQNGDKNATTLVSPHPSRATAYLRHISSAPNMMRQVPSRPHSTNATSRSGQSKSSSKARRTPVNLNVDTATATETECEDSEDDRTMSCSLATLSSHPPQPPLPTTWLETVARAVLFGGAGAHVGGPLVVGSEASSSDLRVMKSKKQVQRQLRPSRSSLSQASSYHHHHHHRPIVKSPLSLSDGTCMTARSGLSDQTNLILPVHASNGMVPPALFSSVSKRHSRGDVEVSLTRVICRSAPGSRAGSVVRSSGEEGRGKRKRGDLDASWGSHMFDFGMEEERLRGRGRVKRGWFGGSGNHEHEEEVVRRKEKKKKNKDKKDKDKEHVRVPSLARTKVEGDVWAKSKLSSSKQKPKATMAGYYTTGTSSHNGDEGDDDDDEFDKSYEDDDEDSDNSDSEPTLARMLLRPPPPTNHRHPDLSSSTPVPRRQQSIKSLRRVLAREGPAVGSSAASASRNNDPGVSVRQVTSVKYGRGHDTAAGG